VYLALRVAYRRLFRCLVVLASLDRMHALEDVWRQRLASMNGETFDRIRLGSITIFESTTIVRNVELQCIHVQVKKCSYCGGL